MLHTVVTLALSLLPSLITGAVAGGLTAHWLLHRRGAAKLRPQPLPPDPHLTARIDRAAAGWARQQGRPEAGRLVADKLHLLHRLGQRRGWLQ